MKGIILAGGSGTRLHPVTRVVSKQLLPVYDKPMVYYPLSTLMLAGIRDVLVISTPRDLPMYRDLLGSGHELGLNLQYAEQPRPGGLAEAFIIGRDFVGNDDVALILGDNIFYGHGLSGLLQQAVRENEAQGGGTVFGYHVKDPERYGVAEFDGEGRVTHIEEKPENPKSDYAITGIYLYDNRVLDVAARLEPSDRGELEITDVNRAYLRDGRLRIQTLGRGVAWLDTGTHQSLHEAAGFIQTVENRQGLKIACLEEIAWRMGYIDSGQMLKLADQYDKSDLRAYLQSLASRTDAVGGG